jgi:hypothetical protein
MTIAAALYAHLTSNAGISKLVASRVYPMVHPATEINEVLAAHVLIMCEEKAIAERRMSGSTQMFSERWLCVCSSGDYIEAHSIADALLAALNMFKGIMGGPGGVDVQACTLLAESDEYTEDLGLYSVACRYVLTYATQ